jgi:hypothetical protein
LALGNKLQMYRTIILVAALMLAGCNQYGIGWDAIQADLDAKYAVERDKRDAERAKETQEAEAREAERKRCETKGGPVVGMTKAQVYAMCGKPSRINTTQTARGSSEQLFYFGQLYVYLTNGIVTAIQY